MDLRPSQFPGAPPPPAAMSRPREAAPARGAVPSRAALAFETRGLEIRLGGKRVLGPMDLAVPHGSFLGILGPNGSGKTTLLRALTGELRGATGSVLLEGTPIGRYKAGALARLVGVVPQQFTLDFAFTVQEMVAMGRYAQDRPADDDPAVAGALEKTGMAGLAGRVVTELSGGERQRALIAQTLAQRTSVLLLDEPLNNLDLNHQLEVMQLLASLHADGRTIVVVLHDLNMAAQYCDELLLLDRGRLAARGKPGDILDPRLILEVFKVRVTVHRQGQRPYLTPLWSGVPEARRVEGLPRVHVIAGGGAASELLENLVARGFAPTVGIVSVFDTDYATARRYELEVIPAPPFEPFPPASIEEHGSLAREAKAIIVAPVFFGIGNLPLLHTVLEAAREGVRVIYVGSPPIEERDLSGGEAARLVRELLSAGAVEVAGAGEAAEAASRV